jgi:hypothetical protein
MTRKPGSPFDRAEKRAAFLRAVLTLEHADAGSPSWSAVPPSDAGDPEPAAGDDQQNDQRHS